MSARRTRHSESLAPVLDAATYTFATVSESEFQKLSRPLAVFREAEGISVVCPRQDAEALGLRCDGSFRRITLSIHSSLAGVGLTARVASALAARGIACNVVAAFHHDHLFIPAGREEEALKILSELKGMQAGPDI